MPSPPPARRTPASAVTLLLQRRATAVLHRDRRAFLRTVDPTQKAFRARQGRLFEALGAVRFSSWSYDVDMYNPSTVPHPGRYRAGQVYAPGRVTLRYRIASFDTLPTAEPQKLTFVRRGTQWLLASDTDFEPEQGTSREIWDFGPVVVARGRHSLVLGHPDAPIELSVVADETDRAVPRVSDVWGKSWARKVVVVVPSTRRELALLLDRSAASLRQIAAVATAELGLGSGPVGNRVLVNPRSLRELGSLGRRIVMTHEVTHVATRATTGQGAPSWLVEGFADYVAYADAQLPVTVVTAELRQDVTAGRVPAALPADYAFTGPNPRLAQAYEGAWLACRLIADRTSQRALVRFYRQVAPGGMADRADRLRRGFRYVLHTTPAAFTASWRRYLRHELA